MLKFEFGWKHWRTGRGFAQEKKNNGGGTSTYDLPRLASLDECQDIAVNVFFPNGKSPVGSIEVIIFMQDGDKPLQFTAEKYKQMTGFRMPRLYLLTRHEDDEAQDDPSEDDLMTPTFYDWIHH